MRCKKIVSALKVAAGISLLGCSLASVAVRAESPAKTSPETATAAVSLADLDLTTPAGMDAARERVTLAAQKLCRHFLDDRKASSWATYTDCSRETVASAFRQLDAKSLVARTE